MCIFAKKTTMEIYQSLYLTIRYTESDSLFVLDWSPETEDISDAGYQKELLAYAKNLQKYKPRRVLIDASKAVYAITPEMQQWINKNVIAVAIGSGLQKTATLLSRDFITKLSIEQTFDEDKSAAISRRFFEKHDQAMQWLLAEK